MEENKNISAEEVLDEEDLEIVSGGTQDEVYTDYNKLKALGFLVKDPSKTTPEIVKASMDNLIADLKTKGFNEQISYTANWNSKKNVYGIGEDQNLTQKKFWEVVNGFYSK